MTYLSYIITLNVSVVAHTTSSIKNACLTKMIDDIFEHFQ